MKFSALFPALCITTALTACQSAPFFSPLSSPLSASSLNSATNGANPALLRSASVQNTSPSRQTYRLQSQTRVLQEPINQPLRALPGQLVFRGMRVFQPGEILIGRSSEGQAFLRRVLSRQELNGQTLVQTTNASLADAFQELDLSGVNNPEMIKPIELDRRTFQLGFVTVESALRAQPDLSDVQIRLENGKALFVRLAPELKLTWDITSRVNLSTLNPATPTTPWATQQVPPAVAPQTGLVLKPIGNVNFKTFLIVTAIGPIPLTIFIKPGAALEWGHQGTGSVELGGQVNGRLKVAVEMKAQNFSQSPDFKSAFDYDYGGLIKDPKLEFTGRVLSRLHLPRLRVESEIAAMIGPYVEASSYLDGDLVSKVTVVGSQKRITGKAEVHLGLALRAGLSKSDLFGDSIPEIHKTLFDRRVKQLYKKDLNYTLP